MSFRRAALGLTLCTLLGLVIRLRMGPPGGGMVEEDAHFHLRRAEQVLRAGPAALRGVDPLINFPDGMRMALPPGYPLLLAGLAFFTQPAPVDDAAAASVPVLGMTAVPVAYALSRAAALSPGVALAAAAAVVVLPAHVELSRLGRVDHHVLEPTLLWGALALLLSAAARRSAWRAVLAGVALAGLFFFSPTALLGAAVYCTAAGWLAQRRAREPALSLLCAGALTGLICARWGIRAPSADELSTLQPALLFGVALVLALGPVAPAGAKRLALLIGLGAALLGAVLASGAVNGVFSFAARRGLTATMVEARGLFAFDAHAALAPLSGLVLAVPFAAGYMLYGLRRRTGPPDAIGAEDRRAVLALVTLSLWLIVLQQRRFMHLGALPVAAVLLWAGAALLGRLSRRWAAWSVGAGLILGAAAPLARYYAEPPAGMSARHHAVRALCDVLQRQPPGAVLSQWPYGHILSRFGGHPVMASPFLTPQTEPAALRATALLLSEDPPKTLAEMDRLGLRYLVATPLVPGVTGRYLQALGDPRPAAQVERGALLSRLMSGDPVPGLRELGAAPGRQAVLFVRE